VSVASFGPAPVEALPWAEHIDAQLTERPVASRQAIQLRLDTDNPTAGKEVRVRLAVLESFTPDHLKVFVQNGLASRESGEAAAPAVLTERSLRIVPASPGQVRVEAFAVAAGKEALNGTLLFDVA
jgi:hypothetical protein